MCQMLQLCLTVLVMCGSVRKNNGIRTEPNKCTCPNGFSGSLCEIESVGLCSDNGTTKGKSLLLVTFGSGPDTYSNQTPASFNFSTSYQQLFGQPSWYSSFDFVNIVCNFYGIWHDGVSDHTPNDADGYMYLVDIGAIDSQVFNLTINNLCIGLHYEFSAYIANIVEEKHHYVKPNIRFEVRTETDGSPLLAQFNTSDICDYDNMTWSKYGLSFIASNHSVVFLMLSNVESREGNDITIDDIELRVCSSVDSGFCPQDSTAMTTSIMPTTRITTEEQTSISPSTPSSARQGCDNEEYIGPSCTVSAHPCEMLRPCQNNGICHNTSAIPCRYRCSCSTGFTGIHCELDRRPCKPYTCLNHGNCSETSNTTFHCTCDDGWQGLSCESMTNYCSNVICRNKGVCRPLLLDYKCECLGDSYSGRHCEIVARKIIILKIVCKSVAYIAIIAMASVAMFVLVMDILKYCFGIDPVHEERERLRREKRTKKPKPPVIQRFIYVNAPSKTTNKRLSAIVEDIV